MILPPPRTLSKSFSKQARIVDLSDCFDFSRIEFEKQISLLANTKNRTPIQSSKCEQIPFTQFASLEYGSPLKEESRIEGEYPVVGSNGVVGFHNEYLIEGPAIIIGRKGSVGKVNWIDRNCFPIDTAFYVDYGKDKVDPKYLYYLLLQTNLKEYGGGVGVPGLNRNEIHRLKFPIPSASIQKAIVKELERVEAAEEANHAIIGKHRKKISDCVKAFEKTISTENVCQIGNGKVQPENIAEDLYYIGLEHIESDTGNLLGRVSAAQANLQSTKNAFKKGDVLFGKLRPYLNKVYLAEFDGVCSTDIMVLSAPHPLVLKHALLNEDFVTQTSSLMKGISLPRLQVKDFGRLKVHYPDNEKEAEHTLANLEKQIEGAEQKLSTAANQKAAILRKYL